MNDRRDRDGLSEERLPRGGRDPNGRLEATENGPSERAAFRQISQGSSFAV
jgi:hypothetical protein